MEGRSGIERLVRDHPDHRVLVVHHRQIDADATDLPSGEQHALDPLKNGVVPGRFRHGEGDVGIIDAFEPGYPSVVIPHGVVGGHQVAPSPLLHPVVDALAYPIPELEGLEAAALEVPAGLAADAVSGFVEDAHVHDGVLRSPVQSDDPSRRYGGAFVGGECPGQQERILARGLLAERVVDEDGARACIDVAVGAEPDVAPALPVVRAGLAVHLWKLLAGAYVIVRAHAVAGADAEQREDLLAGPAQDYVPVDEDVLVDDVFVLGAAGRAHDGIVVVKGAEGGLDVALGSDAVVVHPEQPEPSPVVDVLPGKAQRLLVELGVVGAEQHVAEVFFSGLSSGECEPGGLHRLHHVDLLERSCQHFPVRGIEPGFLLLGTAHFPDLAW